jgi:hypothetical protein
MKTLTATVALFLLTACGSSPASSNAQLEAGRDPACATCAPDCCTEGQAQAAVETKGECCSGTQAKAESGCCSESAAAPKATGQCCSEGSKPKN